MFAYGPRWPSPSTISQLPSASLQEEDEDEDEARRRRRRSSWRLSVHVGIQAKTKVDGSVRATCPAWQ